ncbi:MAG TPA: hypothetical protein VEJ63_09935 [Planctomycetota bacterium]|nr:hypothetical protein [Planctomycetota bacterium]
MPHALTEHGDYIGRYGFLKWLLRECVRANPLYVISAMLLMYGLVQLNTALAAPAGAVDLSLLIFGLLHAYEVAVLAAATVVLQRRQLRGGRDLHGMAMVAVIFLGGSFLALDELITIWPEHGAMMLGAVLLWTAVKLRWYAALPGIVLSRVYRWAILVILAGHSVSSLLGDESTVKALGGIEAARNLGWLCGWISTFAAVLLVYVEREAATAHAWRGFPFDFTTTDVLQTLWCGGWGVLFAWALGVLHLFGSDWVFDRGFNRMLVLPEAIAVLCALMLRWWFFRKRVTFWRFIMFAAPSLLSAWVWVKFAQRPQPLDAGIWLTPVLQIAFCAAAFYLALAAATRRLEFCAGLVLPVMTPAVLMLWGRVWWRAVLTVAGGFLALGAGVVLSLCRDRLLAYLDPPRSEPPAPPEPPASPMEQPPVTPLETPA